MAPAFDFSAPDRDFVIRDVVPVRVKMGWFGLYVTVIMSVFLMVVWREREGVSH